MKDNENQEKHNAQNMSNYFKETVIQEGIHQFSSLRNLRKSQLHF